MTMMKTAGSVVFMMNAKVKILVFLWQHIHYLCDIKVL